MFSGLDTSGISLILEQRLLKIQTPSETHFHIYIQARRGYNNMDVRLSYDQNLASGKRSSASQGEHNDPNKRCRTIKIVIQEGIRQTTIEIPDMQPDESAINIRIAHGEPNNQREDAMRTTDYSHQDVSKVSTHHTKLDTTLRDEEQATAMEALHDPMNITSDCDAALSVVKGSANTTNRGDGHSSDGCDVQPEIQCLGPNIENDSSTHSVCASNQADETTTNVIWTDSRACILESQLKQKSWTAKCPRCFTLVPLNRTMWKTLSCRKHPGCTGKSFTSCKQCVKSYRSQRYLLIAARKKETAEDYFNAIQADAKRRAKLKSVDYNLPYRFIFDLWGKQQQRCAFSGLLMQIKSHSHPWYASLARLKKDKGWCVDNVALVVIELNGAIQMSMEKIKTIADLASNKHVPSVPVHQYDEPEISKRLQSMLAVMATSSGKKRNKSLREATDDSIPFIPLQLPTLDMLTNKIMRQNGRCFYSNVPLQYGDNGTEWRATIERLNPNLDYSDENTALVCHEFNTPAQWSKQMVNDMLDSVQNITLRVAS